MGLEPAETLERQLAPEFSEAEVAFYSSESARFWTQEIQTIDVAFRGNVRQRLWHYTSLPAFHSVVSGRNVRLTNVRFMNDATELEYGFYLLTSIVEENPAELQGAPTLKRDLEAVIDRFKTRGLLFDFYVACFCESPDLLPQWTIYGHQGGGVAVEFDMYRFINDYAAFGDIAHLPPNDPGAQGKGISIRKVEYNESKQREAIRGLLRTFRDSRERADIELPTLAPEKRDDLCQSVLMANIENLLPLLKHPTLSHESEWRVIASLGNYVESHRPFFRSKEADVIPYLEMRRAGHSGESLPITSVRVARSGTQGFERGMRACSLILAANGHRDIEPTPFTYVLRR